MLLVLLRAVVAAREREDQGVVALQLAELARHFRVIGQLVVGNDAAGNDVRAHSIEPPFTLPEWATTSCWPPSMS